MSNQEGKYFLKLDSFEKQEQVNNISLYCSSNYIILKIKNIQFVHVHVQDILHNTHPKVYLSWTPVSQYLKADGLIKEIT